MRRQLLTALVLVPLLSPVVSARADGATAAVYPALKPGFGHSVLLVLLPDTGTTAAELDALARAAQQSAERARLWVAVPAVSAAPADAEVVYASLLAEVREQGFSTATDSDVVVAGLGRGAVGAQQLARTHALASAAAVGSAAALSPVALRVLGELDGSVPVVSTVALSTDPVLVLPATDSTALRGATTGAVLGDLVEHAHGLNADLEGRLASDRLVAAVRRAAVLQQGPICARLQLHTADLAPAELSRITVTNRADPDLISPTPAGIAAGDLGGFLYGKAELVDDGATARLTTSSYVVPGPGPAASEVMCKTKSRSAVAQALYDDFQRVDPTEPTCSGFTETTLAEARAVLSSEAAARSGGVEVLPDQTTSAGPQWVFTPMTVRPTDPLTGRWAVQSPSLVTQLSDTQLDPEFAGNHYCKVLSPLRALELLLQDTVPARA